MLINRTIQIPIFLRVGRHLLEDLPGLLLEHHLHFQSVLVVAGPRSAEIAGTRIARSLGRRDCLVTRDNTLECVESVRRAAREQEADLLVGVGGGTPLDVAKLVAAGERICFLSVPTSPSNDGIASPVAVIKIDSRPNSLAARMPIGVIADLDILQHAPAECIRAGVGDLISNVSAVADWDLACERGKDRMDDFARLLALTGAEAMLRFADGERRLDPASPALLETLIHGLVLSGVAMEIAGSSRPCSGAEHLFSHALDRIATRPAMHGAQVGLGTLLMTTLRGDKSSPLRSSMQRMGLPLRAAEIGIQEREIIEGLLCAQQMRPERYTLLNEAHLTPERAAELAHQAGIV